MSESYLELRRKLTERDRSLHEKVVSLDNIAEEIVGAMGDMAKDNGGGEYAAAK